MWIDRETRAGTCRWCGQVIIWATRPNGRTVALDGPLVFLPSLLAQANPHIVDVDRTHTKLHVQTCKAFDPPLTSRTRARHV